MCSIVNFIRTVFGTLSLVTLGISGYYYINYYDDLDCGDLKYGVGLGITSVLLFLVNILTYMSSCNKSWVVLFCGIFLIGSTVYNMHLYDQLEESCIQKYKDKKIWDYYVYLYVVMILLSIFALLFGLFKICCGSNND